jgi:hypothetical protein
MQRIQYHRYSGPEEMLWPRAIGTDFSGVWIALDHQRFVEASGGGKVN